MNKLQRTMAKIEKLPKTWQAPVRSFLVGKIIPFAGTAGCRIEELTPHRCKVTLRNRHKVGNHIGTVHAAAMALVAESATGFVTGMNVPDDKLLVIRSMELTYLKRTDGDLTAVATLTDQDIQRIAQDDKGEILVPVVMTDEKGTNSVTANMTWAWTPKRK